MEMSRQHTVMHFIQCQTCTKRKDDMATMVFTQSNCQHM